MSLLSQSTVVMMSEDSIKSVSLGDDILVRDGSPAADIHGPLKEYSYDPVMASIYKGPYREDVRTKNKMIIDYNP